MKRLLLAVALCAPGIVHAQSRPSTTAMTCEANKALVNSRQAVVLGTGRDLYERFVSTQAQCEPGQTTEPAFAPASDNPQCMVGWRCKEVSRDDR